jgi:octaprenyl-diphosphate synthase
MAHGTPEECQLIRHAIEQGEVERLGEIVQIVRRTGAIDATREAARREADHAREQLAALPDSDAKTALLELCFRSVERSS